MYSVSKSGKKMLVCHSNGRGQPEPQSKTVSKEQQNLTPSTSWPRSIEVLFIALTAPCRACHASAPAPQVKQGFLEFVKLLAVPSNKYRKLAQGHGSIFLAFERGRQEDQELKVTLATQ